MAIIKDKEYYAKYREENREKIRERDKKWREENPNTVAAKLKKWREENPDKVKSYQAAWIEEHKDEWNEYQREYHRRRRAKLKKEQAAAQRLMYTVKCGNETFDLTKDDKLSYDGKKWKIITKETKDGLQPSISVRTMRKVRREKKLLLRINESTDKIAIYKLKF